MIEEYMIEKFRERVNVLKYGFCYKLDYSDEGIKKLINNLCEIPFRSNVKFKVNNIQDKHINMKGILNGTVIPFTLNKLEKFDSSNIPYRLSDFDDKLEVEIADKLNNILLGEINMIDLYDIYMYFTLRNNEINEELLFKILNKKVTFNLVKLVDKNTIREEWNNFRTSIYVSFESILSVLEKIVLLSEKVLV